MNRTRRLQIPDLGEYYSDMLQIEAALKNRTIPQEASSLLCSKLQEREDKRRKMVEHLATKRGISFDDMWAQLISGNYSPISDGEFQDDE